MKNKLITIAAFLAVMVAMTGIAAAATEFVIPDPLINVGTTEFSDQIVTVITTDDEQITSFNIAQLKKGTNIVNIGDVFDTKVDDVVGTTATCSTTTPCANGTSFKVSYKLKNLDDAGKYYVKYEANGELTGNDYVINATLITIPEFPTVAIPVAAVIGLVFLFQRRKNKEE